LLLFLASLSSHKSGFLGFRRIMQFGCVKTFRNQKANQSDQIILTYMKKWKKKTYMLLFVELSIYMKILEGQKADA
jgi:hypothetical protein